MKHEKGFTLLEVMVAITILSVALLGILQLFSKSLDSARLNKEYTLALIFLQSKFSEIEQGLEENRKGEFNERYRWEANLQPTDTRYMEEIRLKITWPGKKKEKKIELVTYRLIKEGD